MDKNKIQNGETEEQVYGNESFGIPSDCTKKQKFSSVKLVLYIVIVALLCTGVYAGFREATSYLLPSVTFDKTNKPILYVKPYALAAKYEKEQKSRVVSQNEKVYSDTEVSGRIFITTDGKNIFHPGEISEENTFDLYCESEEKSTLVAENISMYKAHPRGQFILYVKDSVLYISDMKKPEVIAYGVTDFYLSKNSQQVIYFREGGRMYTCGTGEKRKSVLIDSDITKLLTAKDNYIDIYYIKENSLYNKKTGEKTELVAENVFDGIVLGENVYFTRRETVDRLAAEYIVDDMLASDEDIAYPEVADFKAENSRDEDAYSAAQNAYEEKLVRDDLRSQFAVNYIKSDEFTLYTVKRNDEVKIDEMLTGGYLNYNSSKDIIVYEKNVFPKGKILMSEISSVEDAISKIENLKSQTTTSCMQVLAKGKRPFKGTESFPDGHIEISLDGKFIYCIENIGENGKGTLVRYTILRRELGDRTELCKNVTDFALDGSDSSVTAIFNGETMGICVGETYTRLSDNTCHKFYYVDGTMFFYDNFDFLSQSGQLKYFRDGKIKLVDNYVYDFDVRNYRTVSYIKNYNHESDGGNLYLKEGNKKRKIDSQVREILY